MRRAFLAGFAFVWLPLALFAQADTTVVVEDKTGLFGPVIDRAWPIVAAFLASLSVKIATLVSDGLRNSPEIVKWAGLYGFSLAYNLFATYAGLANVDPLTETWADGALIPAVQMGAAALIFKFGGRKVPALEPTSPSAFRDTRDV